MVMLAPYYDLGGVSQRCRPPIMFWGGPSMMPTPIMIWGGLSEMPPPIMIRGSLADADPLI